MDSLLRRAIERRERETAEQDSQQDKRPRCEVCESHLYTGTRRCRRTGRFDTGKRCIECLDIQEVRRPQQLAPAKVSDPEILFEDELDDYVRKMAEKSDGDEDWSLYQELMANEEDRPEPVFST